MNNNSSCILYPDAPNGEESRLYKKLLKKLPDRPLTNWFYAYYNMPTSDIANKMDQAGYQRNSQGQHNAEDLLKFLDYGTMEAEIANLSSAEIQLGAVDTNGKRVDFTNAEDALRKADDFNNTHKGLVATVVQHGDVYNIIVAEKNSRTHTYADTIKDNLKAWDIYKQVFNAVGVDITSVPQEIQSVFNPLNDGLAKYLKSVSKLNITNIYKRDALLLFSLNPNSRHIQNLINAFSSIEDAAQALDDFNHGSINLSNPQQTLLLRAVNDAQKFQGVDLDALITQIKGIWVNTAAYSVEQDIKQEIRSLDKKYNIEVNEIHRATKKIKTLSDAAADAVVTLQRQIRQLEKEKGNNTEGRRLEIILNRLMKELACKKYCSGVLNFLGEASIQISNIDNMLQNIPQTGTELEKAFGTAKILQDIKSLKDQYYTLVSALADENLIIDESISQNDINNIRMSAKNLKDFFDKKDKAIDDLTEGTMINLMLQIVGNTAPDGQSIINAVRMAAADSSYMNYLYSMGRASNPVVAAAGSIIHNAQDSRDKKINDISLRIRRATDKLYKAGFNSEFMYEDEGHIASDIDWELYKATRQAKIKSFYAQNLRGFDLKQAIEDWEDQNTEERVVDKTNGRTERVPNSNYRKQDNFQKDWFPEQIEYYDTMMQLKGEIGSLLPTYAQHQYLPPQVRRKFLDAMNNAKSIKDVGKAIKDKIQNLYKVREDDENYNTNGIIDGDEYSITHGAFDNTPLRQIPIFFINKVEQGELLRNFSSGIQALAGTAVNYDAMSQVADVVEFIGNFIKTQEGKDNKSQADIVQNGEIRVFKDLWKRAMNTNTQSIIEGFISQHIYGQTINPNENKTWSKIFGNIVAYSSFKGLATNVKGAVANYLMGEFQMLIEAGAGEFYGFKDYAWAHTKLFGNTGVKGEFAELLTNNINHKSVLMRELFDPLQENFSQKSHTKYYTSMFRQLVSHDCSFIGYSSGEYLIHYVNMYALLHNQKVLLNGKKISLYDAFEVKDKQDGNSELHLKTGVTDLDGNVITDDFIDKIRKKLRYVNQSTHGAMNDEDKGILHQKWWGRGIMNFRQWMVEHYSRRFRARHFDASLGMDREGYWVSLWKGLANDDTKDIWKRKQHAKAIGMFMKDFYTFMLRSEAQWHNLDEMQRYNIKRVRTEMLMFACLLGLSFTLGAPEDHKKEAWRRFWIYQTKRALLDTEASMPVPQAASSILTTINSPMASLNTINGFFYAFYGLGNGDVFTEIKSGDHKGENKYVRNMLKYVFPFFKDWEQMQKMDEDDAIFKVFENSPSNH